MMVRMGLIGYDMGLVSQMMVMVMMRPVVHVMNGVLLMQFLNRMVHMALVAAANVRVIVLAIVLVGSALGKSAAHIGGALRAGVSVGNGGFFDHQFDSS